MDRIKLTIVMLLWGSIGVFTRSIDLSPIILAFLRAIISLPIIFIFFLAKGQRLNYKFSTLKPYIVSGVLLGFGWATLFYGYKNTSVSSAVIIYNMCPIYVLIAAPTFLKEKITKLQICIISISFIGLFLVIGNNAFDNSNIFGMLLSGVSGILYSLIVIINRKVKNKIDSSAAALIQILTSSIVLLPIVILEGELGRILTLDSKGILFTIILGIVHTGIAYVLYFSTYHHMLSIEIATYSYLEPIFGIMLSVTFLSEILSFTQILGGIMILSSTYIGEYIKSKKEKALANISSL